ncbi:hypothetical protein GCM10007862_15280 [Dyella lipolytica]|nr:hypothetical protein GCM10007862_15280 [Dyella lipolytica]
MAWNGAAGKSTVVDMEGAVHEDAKSVCGMAMASNPMAKVISSSFIHILGWQFGGLKT